MGRSEIPLDGRLLFGYRPKTAGSLHPLAVSNLEGVE